VRRSSLEKTTGEAPSGESAADARLVACARDGDREAFGRLHDLYARMVHGILLARVPSRDADDLVQDVFLLAMTKIRSLRVGTSFGAWIAAIARNRAADHCRFRGRAPRTAAELPDEVPTDSPPSAEAAEALDAVRSLPEAYRETLVLRLVEGMTGPEIAERTGLTAASVRVNLCRGMKLLRSKLGLPEDAGEGGVA